MFYYAYPEEQLEELMGPFDSENACIEAMKEYEERYDVDEFSMLISHKTFEVTQVKTIKEVS